MFRSFYRTAVPVVTCLLFNASACGPRKPPLDATQGGDPEQPLRLDPIHVHAVRDQERLAIEAYDAAGLFERAAAQLRKGQCGDAVTMYEQLVREFPESDFAAPALYNSGLCNEQLEQYQAAASDYLELIEDYPDSRDVTDALFRLAGAYEKLEAWNDAARVLGRLINDREDLEGIEKIEALARQGSSLIPLGKVDEARFALDEAVRLFRTGSGVSPSASTFHYAMARFKIGEIVQTEMRAVELPADEAALEPALERKCQLLLDAQTEYTRAIKIGHPHWAAAAAYRIGNLYRSLWDDMVATPAPADLDEDAKRLYKDVLKERIRVLLRKAVVQWERTLKMARRLNMDNDWVDRTTEELREIREILTLENESTSEGGE